MNDLAPTGTPLMEPRERYDPAYIGVLELPDGEVTAVYSKAKVMALLVESEGSGAAAEDWFHFNMVGSRMWLFLIDEPDELEMMDFMARDELDAGAIS